MTVGSSSAQSPGVRHGITGQLKSDTFQRVPCVLRFLFQIYVQKEVSGITPGINLTS